MQDFWKAFRRNPDGSWTCVAPATLEGPGGRRIQVTPGSSFVRGTNFMGIDLAEWLDANAVNAAAPPASGAGRAGSRESGDPAA